MVKAEIQASEKKCMAAVKEMLIERKERQERGTDKLAFKRRYSHRYTTTWLSATDPAYNKRAIYQPNATSVLIVITTIE